MVKNIGIRYEVPTFSDDGLPVFVRNVTIDSGKKSVHVDCISTFLILLCKNGSGELLANSNKYAFCSGDVVIIPPNILHSIYSSVGCECAGVYVEPHLLLQSGFTPETAFELVVNDGYIFNLCSKILLETDNPGPFSKPRVTAYLLLLFSHLCAEHPVTDIHSGTPVSFHNRANLANALEYIRANINRRITLDELCRAANMSRYHFCRCFREYLKCSPFEYINMVKCTVARTLLRQGKRVAETADAIGINNIQYFSRMYKDIMGVSPSKDVE